MLITENLLLMSTGIIVGFLLAFAISLMMVNGGVTLKMIGILYVIGSGVFLLGLDTLAVYLPAKEASNIEPAITTKLG